MVCAGWRESGRPGCVERCYFADPDRHGNLSSVGTTDLSVVVGSGQRDSPRIAMTEAVGIRSGKDVFPTLER